MRRARWRLTCVAIDATDNLRNFVACDCVVSGVFTLGRKCNKKGRCWPRGRRVETRNAERLPCSSGGTTTSSVVPGYVVLSNTTKWPAGKFGEIDFMVSVT